MNYVRALMINQKMFFDPSKVFRLFKIQKKEEVITEQKFKKLSSKKIISLSTEEKIEYYKNLRAYYKTLDYNEKDIKKSERNYKLAAKIIIPTFTKLINPNIINQELIPEESNELGTIFVSNHLNDLDQFSAIKAVGMKRPMHIMISSSLLKLKRGILYKNVGCIVADLHDMKSMMRAIDEAAKIVLNGGDVMLFPEGTRNATENFMLPFKQGAVMLAQLTGANIVPLGLTEDYRPFADTNLYLRIGEKMSVSIDDDLVEANKKLEDNVRTLVWENMIQEKQDMRQKIIDTFNNKKKRLEIQRQKINENAK